MSTEEQLQRVVRQIRNELEWAQRSGIVVDSPNPAAASVKPTPTAAEPTPALLAVAPLAVAPVAVASAPASVGSTPVSPPPPATVAPAPVTSPQYPPSPPATEMASPGPLLPSVAPTGVSPSAAASPVPAPGALENQNLPPSSAPRLPVLAEQLAACTSLEGVREVLGDCTRCKLHRLGRQQIVYGVGNPQAEIMFVGEGPGAEEDRRGEPFVGAAGELLTSIIENGMRMARRDVYIANVVKCRPPQNRDPEPDEVAACEPFLAAQIRLIRPKVVVALGRHAAHSLLGVQTPISRLRGKWTEYQGTPLMPTYHPAYLLRNPAEKRAVWEDVKEVLRFVGRPLPERGR